MNSKTGHKVEIYWHLRSVASHFMLFSGVSWPKSALTIAESFESDRVFWSPQVPKYLLPLALKAVLTLAFACRSLSTEAEHSAVERRSPVR